MIFRSIFYSMEFSLFEVSGIILIRSLNRQVFRENWKLDARISIHFSTGIYNFQPLNVRLRIFDFWTLTYDYSKYDGWNLIRDPCLLASNV